MITEHSKNQCFMDTPQPQRHISSVTALFVFAVWAAATARMFFFSGTGDHDAFMMAAGVSRGLNTGRVINLMDYGSNAQFMFYYIFNLIGGVVTLNSARALLLLNLIGTACALIAPVLLFVLIKRNFRLPSPYVVPVLVITNSAYLFSLPYGHPFQIAFVVALASLMLFFEGIRGYQGKKAVLIMALAAVLQGLALTIRAEQVFLFWFCIFGLMIYSDDTDRKRRLGLVFLFAAALAIFFSAHRLLVPPLVKEAVQNGHPLKGVFAGAFKVIAETYSPESLKWSMAYHLTEIGLPIIFLTLFFIIKDLRQGRLRPILGLAVSITPSLLIYIGNPTPPRHFIITVIALSIFIGLNLTTRRPAMLALFGVCVLLINTALPPLLNIIERGGEHGRRNHTYNFLQKIDRDKAQVRAAFPFFKNLVDSAPTNTVILGKWVHLSEISMILSDEKGLGFERVKITPAIKTLEITYRSKKIYLVECYRADQAGSLVQKIKAAHPEYRFFSLINGPGAEINDLHIDIPESINMWSS